MKLLDPQKIILEKRTFFKVGTLLAGALWELGTFDSLEHQWAGTVSDGTLWG
jgi:hypothetical protein